MALIFADNVQKALVDEPPVLTGSNLGYGKYRVFYDTINFADTPAGADDDIVIAQLTGNATIWSLFRIWATIGVTPTLTLGLVNKVTGTFTPLGPALDVSGPAVALPVQWDSADPTAAAALPAVVNEVFALEATRPGREANAWLVFRVDGIADTGIVKFEVPATVE